MGVGIVGIFLFLGRLGRLGVCFGVPVLGFFWLFGLVFFRIYRLGVLGFGFGLCIGCLCNVR